MEGPQTRALADHLGEQLAGRAIEQIIVPEDRWQANVLLLNCVGQVVQRVRSHGKWMFFDFSHGITWMCQLITRSKWSLRPGREGEESHPRPVRGGEGKRRSALMRVYFRAAGAGGGAG